MDGSASVPPTQPCRWRRTRASPAAHDELGASEIHEVRRASPAGNQEQREERKSLRGSGTAVPGVPESHHRPNQESRFLKTGYRLYADLRSAVARNRVRGVANRS